MMMLMWASLSSIRIGVQSAVQMIDWLDIYWPDRVVRHWPVNFTSIIVRALNGTWTTGATSCSTVRTLSFLLPILFWRICYTGRWEMTGKQFHMPLPLENLLIPMVQQINVESLLHLESSSLVWICNFFFLCSNASSADINIREVVVPEDYLYISRPLQQRQAGSGTVFVGSPQLREWLTCLDVTWRWTCLKYNFRPTFWSTWLCPRPAHHSRRPMDVSMRNYLWLKCPTLSSCKWMEDGEQQKRRWWRCTLSFTQCQRKYPLFTLHFIIMPVLSFSISLDIEVQDQGKCQLCKRMHLRNSWKVQKHPVNSIKSLDCTPAMKYCNVPALNLFTIKWSICYAQKSMDMNLFAVSSPNDHSTNQQRHLLSPREEPGGALWLLVKSHILCIPLIWISP